MPSENEQQFLWRGHIEWKHLEKTSTIQQPKTTLIPCGMGCQSKTDEDELNTSSWPKTLSLQLISKRLMVDIMKNHLKRSKIVRFYFPDGNTSQNLSECISTNYVGCVHVSHESQSETCGIEIILLLYAAAKNAYVGLIPWDQIQFIDDFTKLSSLRDHIECPHEKIQDQNIEDSNANNEYIVTSPEQPTVATELQEFERTSVDCKRKFMEDDANSANLSHMSNETDAETVIVPKVSFKRRRLIERSSTPKLEEEPRSNEPSISDSQDIISKLINDMKVMSSNIFIAADQISNEYLTRDSIDAERLLVSADQCRLLVQKTRKNLDRFDEVINSSSRNLRQIIGEPSSAESNLSTELDVVENSEEVNRIAHEQADLDESKTIKKTTRHRTKIPNLVNDSINIIEEKRLKSKSISPTTILPKRRRIQRLRKNVLSKYSPIASSESGQSDISQDSPLKARSKVHASTDIGPSHNSNELDEDDRMLPRRLRKNPRRLESDNETTSSIVTSLSNKKQSLNERVSLSPTLTLSNLSRSTVETCSTSSLKESAKKKNPSETETNETSSPEFYESDAKLQKNCRVVLERLERQSTVELVDVNDQIGHDTNKITPSVLLTQNGCGTFDELPGQCSKEISSNVTVGKNCPNFLTLNNLPLAESKSCDTGKSRTQTNQQKKQDEMAESRVCYEQESLTDITNAKSANPDSKSRFPLRYKSSPTKNVTRNSNSECGVASKFFERITTSVDQEKNDQNSISNLKPAVLMLHLGGESKKSFVTVHPALTEELKPHQVQGVRFMWNKCVKHSENIDGFGCILAHCTGSGKTFQVIALTHTLCMHPDTGVKMVMIVCPLSVMPHWIAEYEARLKHVDGDKDLKIFQIKKLAQSFSLLLQLQTWHVNGGVMLVSFDMFKRLTNEVEQPMTRNLRKTIVKCLIDPGPDLVVCDDGHMLKSEDSDLSRSLSRVKTLRRIVLTSKSLQDDFSKYHCMMQFVRPNFLGTKEEFSVKFLKPIINGQFEDSSDAEVMLMETKFHSLCQILASHIQRFDHSVLAPYLPPKQEYVISIRLTKVQTELYRYCINNITRHKSNETFYLDYQALQKIWTHPCLLPMIFGILRKKNIAKWKDLSIKSGSSNDSCVSDNLQSPSKTNLQTDYRQIKKGKQFPPNKRWWRRFVRPHQLKDMRESSKLHIFFDILNKSEKVGDKVLLLSESFRTLSLVEKFLSQQPQRRSPDNDTSQWVAGSDYFRLDKHTTVENKRRYCQIFNNPKESRARLFIVSTQAIMLGMKFTGANRVVLFDSGREASQDMENILKVHRFDQTKPCYIYRLLSHGTMEEKIYNSQFTGLRLSSEDYDQQQHARFYKNHDLSEFYKFEPNTGTNENTLNTPRDPLLARVLAEHEDLIDSCQEYDSLLENRVHQIMQGFEID